MSDNVKPIKLEAVRAHELASDVARHRLVVGGSNMDTVIHLSDQELDNLRTVAAEYNPVTREAVER